MKAASSIAAATLLACSTAGAAEIKVLSTQATEEAYRELVPQFEKASEHKVTTVFTWTLGVMKRLQDEYMESGRGPLFEQLEGCLARDPTALPYVEIGARLNLSEAAVKMAVQRLRARYQAILREEIAKTVASPEDVEPELRDLFSDFRH